MCFIIKKDEPKIAEEDIKVIKVLSSLKIGRIRILVSPFWKNRIYRIGKISKSRLSTDKLSTGDYTIYLTKKGLYSYGDLESAKRDIHFCSNKRYVYFKAIIPKGSEYYKSLESDVDMYCSNRLKLIKEIIF